MTKPLVFTGNRLALNFATSASDGLQVELRDSDGRALPGFSLDDCPVVFGDSIERVVSWRNGSGRASLAGKAVRLRIALRDADLYAFQFQE